MKTPQLSPEGLNLSQNWMILDKITGMAFHVDKVHLEDAGQIDFKVRMYQISYWWSKQSAGAPINKQDKKKNTN